MRRRQPAHRTTIRECRHAHRYWFRDTEAASSCAPLRRQLVSPANTVDVRVTLCANVDVVFDSTQVRKRLVLTRAERAQRVSAPATRERRPASAPVIGPGLHLPAPHTSVLWVNHLAYKRHPNALQHASQPIRLRQRVADNPPDRWRAARQFDVSRHPGCL